MPRFTTAITISGQRVETSIPRGTKAWRLANAVFCPLGPAPMQAWFVMTASNLAGLDKDSAHTIAWQQVTDDGSADRTLSFPGLYIVKAERLMHGGPGDANALYLVEFADGRYLAARNSDSGVVQVNLRSYANAADYLTGTEGGTWDNLVSALWSACGTLGSFPGLPYSPDGVPQNTWLLGLNAFRALTAVLEQLDCAIQGDPFSTNFTIVQLGEAQGIPAAGTTLQWNSEPLNPNVSQAAAQLKIYHYFHYKAYGQERDTELASNWAYNTGGPTALDTNITGAQGILPLWDDLPLILDENNQITNQTAVNTRDSARVSRYATRYGVQNQHRIHWGLLTDFVPGGLIRAVLWRNWEDGEESPLGGTVTEFVSGSQLITGLKQNDSGPAWFDAQLVAPEREQYAPPDVGRHSYPNYPRLPNIVQVQHTGDAAGDTVDADATNAYGVKFHRGKVRRFVSGGMATLDACWVLFVDDYDTKGGDVKAKQGDFYGPARLSGVTTCAGELLPVYVVRSSSTQAGGSETVVFELTAVLDMEGLAAAKICNVDPMLAEYVAGSEAIVVTDFYRNPGMWQASIGHKGLARKRSDGKYDVIFMERPALFTNARLAPASPGDDLGQSTADPAAIDQPSYFQQGEKIPPGALVTYDPVAGELGYFFPRALTGARTVSVWNDVESRRELLLCQQQGIYAHATLKETLRDQSGSSPSDEINIEGFTIDSFSPFNLTPFNSVATKIPVINYLHLHGEPGDLIVLLWMEGYLKWMIIGVNEDQRNFEFVTVTSDNGNGNLQTGAMGLSLFRGRTVTPYYTGDPLVYNSRPCVIQFVDYGLNNDTIIVAELGKVYGPAKWVGTTTVDGQNNTPVFRTTVGEQEWHGKLASDKAKGESGAFTLHDREEAATGILITAKLTYNKYKANKWAIIKRIGRDKAVANQIECGT